MKALKIIFLVLMLLSLSACDDDSSDAQPASEAPTHTQTPQPQVQPATATPRVRVVTLTPRPPSPTPTPDYRLSAYEGYWTLLLRYDLLDGAWFDRLTYSGTASVEIGLDRRVSGSGEFSQYLQYKNCPTAVLNATSPSFTVDGDLRLIDDNVQVYLKLTPDDINFVDSYRITCFDAETGNPIVEEHTVPLLWRIMQAAGHLEFTFDLARWSSRTTMQEDLSTLLNEDLAGRVEAEVYFGR